MRKKFQHEVDAAGISQLSALGIVAAQTAYKKGDEWYHAMLSYVRENITYLKTYVAGHMPGVNVIDGEGNTSFVSDFSKTGIDPEMSLTAGSSTMQSCGLTAERSLERREPDSSGSTWQRLGRRWRCLERIRRIL